MSDPYERGEVVVWQDGRWVPAEPTLTWPQPEVIVQERPRSVGRIDCWRCGASNTFDTSARDEYGNDDAHCLTCGARTRPPTVIPARTGDPTKSRRRGPRIGQIRL